MNANDQLSEHNCTENYYQHNFGMKFTDGVKALCDQFECYWFLDIVVSYQPELELAEEDFQVWKLKKNDDGSAVVTCTNGNDKVLKQQRISFTDFKADEATVWVEADVILLPSEH